MCFVPGILLSTNCRLNFKNQKALLGKWCYFSPFMNKEMNIYAIMYFAQDHMTGKDKKLSHWAFLTLTIVLTPCLQRTVSGKPVTASMTESPLTMPFFFFFRVAGATYGSSQAWGPVRTAAASLCNSHSNTTFQPHLQSTPQLTATPDP